MWTSIVELASNFFGAIKETFGFAGKRSDLNNTADMKQAKEAKGEAAANDKASKAIATKNLDEIRNDLAE